MGLEVGGGYLSEDRSIWGPGGGCRRETGTLWVPIDDGGQEADEKPFRDVDEGQQPQVIDQHQP